MPYDRQQSIAGLSVGAPPEAQALASGHERAASTSPPAAAFSCHARLSISPSRFQLPSRRFLEARAYRSTAIAMLRRQDYRAAPRWPIFGCRSSPLAMWGIDHRHINTHR